MKESLGRAAAVLTVCSTVLLSLVAAVVPGRWEKVDALQTGTSISVTLMDGALIQGRFVARNDLELVLETSDRRMNLPIESVRRVAVPVERPDRLVNGTLLGLAAGLALGGTLAATNGSAEVVSDPGRGGLTGNVRSGDSELNDAVLIAGSAAAGALFGLLIDASKDNRKTRYETIYLSAVAGNRGN